MARQLSDGERELWQEMQREAAPDVVVLSQKSVKARKEHTCDLCGQTIIVGDSYEAVAFLEDGEFQTHKMHLVCPPREGELIPCSSCGGAGACVLPPRHPKDDYERWGECEACNGTGEVRFTSKETP